MGTRRAPQRWAVCAAWAAFLVTIPSALWRVLMILDLMPGTRELQALHADEKAYVWGLSLVQVPFGALALGLVQGWGERLGRWSIPRWFPVIVGGLGALAVTWLFTIDMTANIFGGSRPDQYTVHGVPLAVMFAAYLPILAWGPLLLTAVAGYWARRQHEPRH